MWKITTLFLITTLSVFISPEKASAAENNFTKNLTWEECIRITKENNPDIQSYQSIYQSTQYLESAAYGSFLPQVSAKIQEEEGRLTLNGTNTNGYSSSLTASENLFNGFSDLQKIEEASANTEYAKATLIINLSKLSQSLVAAYSNLKNAMEVKNLSSEIKNRRQQNLRMIELRAQSGRENKGSFLLSKANLKLAQLDFLKASHEIETATTRLHQLMNFTISENLSLMDQIPLNEPPSVHPDFIKLAQINPLYLQALALEKASRAAFQQTKSSFYPSLTLSGSLGWQDQIFSSNNDSWSTALTLNIPLFSGGKDYYSSKSSGEKYFSAVQNRVSLLNSMSVLLRKSYFSYVEAVERLKVDESFQEAALLRAEIARKQYNNGLITFQEWDQIENDLIQRQKNYLESKNQRILQESLWNQQQGRGVF